MSFSADLLPINDLIQFPFASTGREPKDRLVHNLEKTCDIRGKAFQSVALVQQSEGDKNKMLLRWQTNQNCWEFILADRLNNESFRESVTREVAWQLSLNRKSGFLVSNMAQLSMEYVETMPDESQHHIAVAFYNVHIYRQPILKLLTQDPSNRWMSAAEDAKGNPLTVRQLIRAS